MKVAETSKSGQFIVVGRRENEGSLGCKTSGLERFDDMSSYSQLGSSFIWFGAISGEKTINWPQN